MNIGDAHNAYFTLNIVVLTDSATILRVKKGACAPLRFINMLS